MSKMYRKFVERYGAVSIILYLAAIDCSAALKESQPHIILILADDLGWNDVSFHGYTEIPTPNIDRLAGEGVILNSHYTHYLCTPSRAALMTGKYPIRLGLQHRVISSGETRGLPLKEKLLPQYLKELGYSTHLIGKWHLGYYKKSMTPSTTADPDSIIEKSPPEYAGYDLWDNLEPVAYNYTGRYATEVFTEKALHRIENHDFSTPLFLFLSHLAPHAANPKDPVQAPAEYIARFPHIHPEGRRKYAATVSALDDSVGLVIDALVKKDVLNNTIVVFASDNGGVGPEKDRFFGPPFSYSNNWPLRGGKTSQWDGGLRTIALVWSKLLKVPKRISTGLYHIADWLPTLYKLAGGTKPLPAGLDGMDIWQSISEGTPSPRTEILLQADPTWKEYALRWNQYKLVYGSFVNNGVRLDDWYLPASGLNASYIVPTGSTIQCSKTEPEVAQNHTNTVCEASKFPCLFDMDNDSCEQKNIADHYPDIVQLMMEKIRQYNMTAVPCILTPRDPASRTTLSNGMLQSWINDV